MVLYSASRWSSVNFMFLRLKKVKLAITRLPSCVMNEKEERGIDETFELPSELAAVAVDPTFWKGVERCIAVFDPICKCLGILESDTSTMATAYAAFVYIYIQITNLIREEDVRSYMLSKLLYRWSRIYSPVHALAFFCDPFFYDFRVRVEQVEGAAAIELGKENLKEQCRHALKLVSRLEEDPETAFKTLLAAFMQHCITEKQLVESLRSIIDYQPAMLWGQARNAQNDVLASLLIKVYSGPGSSAGVERQHKTGNRVHTAQRNRMGDGKVERQVAVAYNTASAARVMATKRHNFEYVIANINSDHALEPEAEAERNFDSLTLMEREIAAADEGEQAEQQDRVDPVSLFLTEQELTEQDSLERVLPIYNGPEDIPDHVLSIGADEVQE